MERWTITKKKKNRFFHLSCRNSLLSLVVNLNDDYKWDTPTRAGKRGSVKSIEKTKDRKSPSAIQSVAAIERDAKEFLYSDPSRRRGHVYTCKSFVYLHYLTSAPEGNNTLKRLAVIVLSYVRLEARRGLAAIVYRLPTFSFNSSFNCVVDELNDGRSRVHLCRRRRRRLGPVISPLRLWLLYPGDSIIYNTRLSRTVLSAGLFLPSINI